MSLGFVIIRHINDEKTAEYWKESCLCIRKFYDNPILIVDDDSDPQFASFECSITDCTIVKSEYPRRGELLGYYYFYKLKPFDKAVIIHDSVFMNSKINFEAITDFRSLWSFDHRWDNTSYIISKIVYLEPCGEIITMYLNKAAWVGCFGIMAVISWNFLDRLVQRFNMFERLFPHIICREDRCSLERIIACLVAMEYPQIITTPHIINNIHTYGWGSTWAQYKAGQLNHLPIIKVWTGR